MQLVKQILAILAAGYILLFYSELSFWAHVRPEDSLSNWLMTWLAYSLLAYVLLALIAHFRVRTIWALFLVGAVFGWLAEGLIVQTAYESLPLSISFTGLAWHALITVWIGWYALRKALHSGLRRVIMLAAAIGLAYGFWSITWWSEPDGSVALPLEFAGYAFLTSILLILAYWVQERTLPAFRGPNRIAAIAVAALFLAYFAFVTVPAAPVSAVILPLLLLAVLLTLRHNRRTESRASLLEDVAGAEQAGNYLGLLFLPLAATVVYTAAFIFDVRWHSNWIVYLVTTPAGFVLLFVSFFKVWRRQAVVPIEEPDNWNGIARPDVIQGDPGNQVALD